MQMRRRCCRSDRLSFLFFYSRRRYYSSFVHITRRWGSGLITSSPFSFTAVSMALRHRTSPATSGVSPTSVRGGACARRQHPLSSFLHRGCPLSATVPFRWPRRECGTVCWISSRRQRCRVPMFAHVQAALEDRSVSEKLLNTGCFRRLEHLPSHVILFAFNFVRCPCSRSDIMPP